jgi:hypothetical protein
MIASLEYRARYGAATIAQEIVHHVSKQKKTAGTQREGPSYKAAATEAAGGELTSRRRW